MRKKIIMLSLGMGLLLSACSPTNNNNSTNLNETKIETIQNQTEMKDIETVANIEDSELVDIETIEAETLSESIKDNYDIVLDNESDFNETLETESLDEVFEDEYNLIMDNENIVDSSDENHEDIMEITKITEIGVIKSFESNGILIELENGVEAIANISEDTLMDSNLKEGDKVSISHSEVMTMSLPGIWPQVYEIVRVADLM